MDPPTGPPAAGPQPSPSSIPSSLPPITLGDLNIAALLEDLVRSHQGYLSRFFNKEAPSSSPSVSAMETETGPSAQPISQEKPIYVKEIHSETSPASTAEDDDFTPVQSRTQKRKLKASKSLANPPKKVGISAASRGSTSTSSSAIPDSPASPDPEPQDADMEEEPRKEKVPPLYIREKTSWQRVLPLIARQDITFNTARSTRVGIRVDCPSANDHRRLTSLLRKENIGFHTYALPEEKQLRVVVRGLPKELDTELIKNDLLSQDLPIHEVHRMYHPRTKYSYDMVLVILDNTPLGKKIYNITTVCGLSGLKIERPNSRGRTGQCHRCQLYGHSARNCYARPRCVKCLGDHATSDCERKQPTEEPPSCVLCKAKGHPANYRGCPKAPREPKHRNSKAGGKPATAKKPKFVDAPLPTTNAWAKPIIVTPVPSKVQVPVTPTVPTVATPKVAAQPASQAVKQNSSASDRAIDNLAFVLNVLSKVNLEELDAFRIECTGVGLRSALTKYRSLLESINNLEKSLLNGQ